MKISAYQQRVSNWMKNCFSDEIANDKVERIDRFIEESIELAQSLNYPKERALALVDYVYNRPIGEPYQEVGGVMITLSALCKPNKLDMELCSLLELLRIERPEIIEKIRIKQSKKPTGSALPQ